MRWLSKTSVLPAVEHRRHALQAYALHRWVAQWHARQRERAAAAFTADTLLRDALAVWRAKAVYLAELRAIRRMGGGRRRTSDEHLRSRLAFVAPTRRFVQQGELG